ncbi:unnamed protein product [Heterobilharzia americana]|nr:unnamed protein product [Heterobilharzia americana]
MGLPGLNSNTLMLQHIGNHSLLNKTLELTVLVNELSPNSVALTKIQSIKDVGLFPPICGYSYVPTDNTVAIFTCEDLNIRWTNVEAHENGAFELINNNSFKIRAIDQSL